MINGALMCPSTMRFASESTGSTGGALKLPFKAVCSLETLPLAELIVLKAEPVEVEVEIVETDGKGKEEGKAEREMKNVAVNNE